MHEGRRVSSLGIQVAEWLGMTELTLCTSLSQHYEQAVYTVRCFYVISEFPHMPEYE
jgi:hypothetical protein